MLVCKIQMWPRAEEAKAHALGEVRITRVAGDRHIAHYDVALMKSASYAQREGPWRAGKVENFRRLTFGPYDLLLRGMVSCIGGRSYIAARNVADEGLLFFPPSSELEIV